METYHFQINVIGNRTPWAFIIHRTRKFKSRTRAVQLAIRAAGLYKAEVRLTTGRHPLESNGAYFRSPFM
jgi:hypothetical protein